jgi:hypothetical protein
VVAIIKELDAAHSRDGKKGLEALRSTCFRGYLGIG